MANAELRARRRSIESARALGVATAPEIDDSWSRCRPVIDASSAAAPVDAASTLTRGMATTQALSTQPLSTQPHDKGGVRQVAGDVPDYLELQEELGRGAMAVVHAALDRRNGERVAVKVMHEAEEASRFVREAGFLAQLTHPAIVRYVAHGITAEGRPFLAMEWLEGEDLAARLAALEATGDKKRAAARPSPLTAILGVAGIVTVGGLAWAALQPSPEAPLPTAAPEEFQPAGSGFGDLAPMPVTEPAPPPAAETSPSASELALMESLATLRAELDDLRAHYEDMARQAREMQARKMR